MTMDLESVRVGMPTMVPMVGTLNLEFLELEPNRCVMRLPDQKGYHNHIAGPHAGAMFTLGESASGALVLGNFAGILSEATPLAVDATIRYKRVAMGALIADASMSRPAEDVLAELQSGSRPEFEVPIEFRTEDGTVTGEMVVRWTLRPNRKPE